MNTRQIIESLRPIDDTFMQSLSEDLSFCEELLQTVLEDSKLKVIQSTPQRNLHNIVGRSVTVDILCKSTDGKMISVEVQKANDDDHQKRVRYNSSCIHVTFFEKERNSKI